jgi:D-glycero-alpha-D-manno-heptose 1-phosphate guanylyltransferase
MKDIRAKDIDVVVLCGGLGTRLRGVIDDCPKPMAEINGRPFLDILIHYVARYGFTRFILCTGYKRDFIRRYYEKNRGKLMFLFSEEDRPLGTAGAIKNAEFFIESNIFLVLNGDSLCEIDLEDFLKFHIGRKTLVSIALTAMKSPGDYGVIELDGDRKVIRFSEKVLVDSNGLVNTGMYLFGRKILGEIPPGEKLSLEYDIFPRILDKGAYGYVTEKELLDIGTSERLELARGYFRESKR